MVISLHTGDVYRKKLSEYDNARYFYQIALNCAKHSVNPNDIELVHKAIKSLEEQELQKRETQTVFLFFCLHDSESGL